MKKKNTRLSVAAAVAAVAASAIYYGSFTKWQFGLYCLSVALYALAAGLLAARFAEKKPVLKGLLAAGRI